MKQANLERLSATLARVDELARKRDPEADDEALRANGVDPTNWTTEAVRAARTDKA